MLKIVKNIIDRKKSIIKINVRNIINKNLNNIMFKIIFNNYKLNILYKTNVKEKKERILFTFKYLS